MSIDPSFQKYLQQYIGLTLSDYQRLGIEDKATLTKVFLTQAPRKPGTTTRIDISTPDPITVPGVVKPPDPITVPDVVKPPDPITVPDVVKQLTHMEKYAILTQSERYKNLCKSIHIKPPTRKRIEKDIRRVEADFLKDQGGSARLWLHRIAYQIHDGDGQSDEHKDTLSAQSEGVGDSDGHKDTLSAQSEGDSDQYTDDESTVTEDESAQSEDNEDERAPIVLSTLSELFLKVLTKSVIYRFNTYLKDLGDEGLAATTILKGYQYIIKMVKNICGGRNLSDVTKKERELARTALGILCDTRSTWNSKGVTARNEAEITKVESTVRGKGLMTMSLDVYFFMQVEVEWYLDKFQKKKGRHITKEDVIRGAGIAYLCTLLARPISRAQTGQSITLEQFQKETNSKTYMMFSFTRHKTDASFGALYTAFAKWLPPILQAYVDYIRDSLDWRGQTHLLFPSNIVYHMTKSFKIAHITGMKPTAMRNMICDIIDQLETSADQDYTRHSDRLHMTAAHRTGTTQVVSRHYANSRKKNNEELLQLYINDRYYIPTKDAINTILTQAVIPPQTLVTGRTKKRRYNQIKTSEPTANPQIIPSTPLVVSNPQVIPSTPLVVFNTQASPTTPPLTAVRTCQNKERKKKCLSEGRTPTFQAHEQKNCDACVQGFLFNGNYTKKRMTTYNQRLNAVKDTRLT